MKTFTLLAGLALSTSLIPISIVNAGTLRVDREESSQTIRVFDGLTASAAYANAPSKGVQVGSVTADTFNNVAFFIGNSEDAQSLYLLRYAVTQQALPQALSPSTFRITHMEWDSSGVQRLLGAGIDTTDNSTKLFTLSGTTITVLAMPEANCCVFRSGVSAFRATDDSLFLLGRRTTDTQDHVFRFNMSNTTLAQVVAVDTDLSINELNVTNAGQLIGLAYSTSMAATRVFTTNAALVTTSLGLGQPNCCFVMAGAAAINTTSNELQTIGSGIGGMQPNPPKFWTFNMGSGAVGGGIVDINGAGMFFDDTAILPNLNLFVDGFE